MILAAALLWSTSGLGIKAVPEPPLKVAAYRSVFAAVALLAFFRPRVRRPSGAFVIAVLSYTATLITFVTAVKWTTAANAILLQYCGIIWILLFSPLVLNEKPGWRDTVAIVVAFMGMLLFFVQQLETRGAAGNLMAVVSSLCFATLMLSLRRERGVGAEAAVVYGNVVVVAVLLPFLAKDFSIEPRSLWILALMGVFQIGLAYVCFVRGLKYVTATKAALTGMIEPIANPLWVFLFLGERPDPTAMIGGAIVLGAVAWRSLSSEPPATLPPD